MRPPIDDLTSAARGTLLVAGCASDNTNHIADMFVLIAYDVSTVEKEGARRLRRVAQACKDYGQRVQKSVFECRIEPGHWVSLRSRLLREIDPAADSLRFYFLDEDTLIEHQGVNKPVDFESPLIL